MVLAPSGDFRQQPGGTAPYSVRNEMWSPVHATRGHRGAWLRPSRRWWGIYRLKGTSIFDRIAQTNLLPSLATPPLSKNVRHASPSPPPLGCNDVNRAFQRMEPTGDTHLCKRVRACLLAGWSHSLHPSQHHAFHSIIAFLSPHSCRT